MEVGFGWRDITPLVGIRLGGYGHRLGKPSQRIHDPLALKVIVLRTASQQAMIVGADVLGVYGAFADEVKEAAYKKTGIKPSNIFLTTTHTHSGPETIIPMWPNTFPYDGNEKSQLEGWMSLFKVKAVEAASEAVANLAETSIGSGALDVPGLTVNRSYGDGPVDPELSIAHFNGGHKLLLLNYACHPVCNTDFGISADYPGEVSSRLAERGYHSLFTTGATGNINPAGFDREGISKLGADLSSAAMKCLAEEVPPLPSKSLKMESRRISVKLRTGATLGEAERRFREEYDACRNKLDDAQSLVRLIYADEEYEISKDSRTMALATIQALNIDDELAFATIPGELFVEIGLKIKHAANQLGYRDVIVATYSGDYIGYIPIGKAFELGTYEARLARWSRVTEEAGESIYSELIDMLQCIRQ